MHCPGFDNIDGLCWSLSTLKKKKKSEVQSKTEDAVDREAFCLCTLTLCLIYTWTPFTTALPLSLPPSLQAVLTLASFPSFPGCRVSWSRRSLLHVCFHRHCGSWAAVFAHGKSLFRSILDLSQQLKLNQWNKICFIIQTRPNHFAPTSRIPKD